MPGAESPVPLSCGAQCVEEELLRAGQLGVALGGTHLGEVGGGVGDGLRGLGRAALAQRGAGLLQVGVDLVRGLDGPRALGVEDA